MMKSQFKKLLISSLSEFCQVVADLLHVMLASLGLIKFFAQVNSNSPMLSGRLDGWIFYRRFGKTIARRRPSSYKIKDKNKWRFRWDKFRAFNKCAYLMKHDLLDLYEGEAVKRTWWNTLSSQMSKFWVKQNDGSYKFSPGNSKVFIGNGSIPVARNVVFSSSLLNTLKVSFDNTIINDSSESIDDTLQLMYIDQKGLYSSWHDLTTITRSLGSFSFVIPEIFGSKIFVAVKFKSPPQRAISLKGNFHFPEGMTPVTILR